MATLPASFFLPPFTSRELGSAAADADAAALSSVSFSTPFTAYRAAARSTVAQLLQAVDSAFFDDEESAVRLVRERWASQVEATLPDAGAEGDEPSTSVQTDTDSLKQNITERILEERVYAQVCVYIYRAVNAC